MSIATRFAAVALVSSIGVAQGQDAAEADRNAVIAASRAFSAAYVRNDAAAVGQAYTQDAVLMPPGREIRGDTAIDVGTWSSTSQRTGGQPVTAAERYLAIWVREADGAWRMQYDMWHRPAPRAAPPATTN